jgi:hypothetical protein
MCFVFQIIQVQLLLCCVLLSNRGTVGKRLSNVPLRLDMPPCLFCGASQLPFCGNRPSPLRILGGLSCKRHEGFYIAQVPLFFFRTLILSCTASFSAATASIHTPFFLLRGGGKIRRCRSGAYNFVLAFFIASILCSQMLL